MKIRLIAILLWAGSASAWAGSFEFDNGLSGRYTLSLGYALAMRTEAPDAALVNGPIDPQTGLPTTMNYDDGDRNFKQGALINNRASALAELFTSWNDYGLVLRGDGFYDNVYHHSNDNDSPGTVNKTGPNDRFTSDARQFGGGRVRLLDAYGYADWQIGSTQVDLRLGRQLVAWGEGLFFGNLAFSQAPADATKINIPGIDVKSILLPVEQVALNLGLTDDLSVMAYYHLRYRPTELEPVGGYFSTVDILGPGAQFAYGFVNPFYDPLANLNPIAGGVVPGLPLLPPSPVSQPGLIPGVQRVILIPRGPDILPRDSGQWGIGTKYQLTSATNVGLYYLRYHDTLPSVRLNAGTTTLAPGVTTDAAPVSYNITYFDNIKVIGASFSTKIGRVNVAGEAIFRDGANVLVHGRFGPTSTRGKVSQAFLSAITLVPPNFLSQEIDLVGEVGYVHVNGITPLEDGSRTLVNDKTAWGFEGIAAFNYRNVFTKWDLAVPVSVGYMVQGTPAMAGAMGVLYGDRDLRASITSNFTYLQNLQLGLSYNAFLGSPSLAARPYTDRDYVAVNAKYSF